MKLERWACFTKHNRNDVPLSNRHRSGVFPRWEGPSWRGTKNDKIPIGCLIGNSLTSTFTRLEVQPFML
jgi:hypothetical protein